MKRSMLRTCGTPAAHVTYMNGEKSNSSDSSVASLLEFRSERVSRSTCPPRIIDDPVILFGTNEKTRGSSRVGTLKRIKWHRKKQGRCYGYQVLTSKLLWISADIPQEAFNIGGLRDAASLCAFVWNLA